MTVYVLERTQSLPLPLDLVFPFFQSPENLARITPTSLGFQILTPSPIVMKVGTLVDYTIRVAGFPIRWRTLITSYNPPNEFVDEQLKGPYSFWHHRHRFTPKGDTTEMQDIVHYALPGGILGSLLHSLFIRRQLHTIFDHRARVIKELMSAQRTGLMV